MLCPDLLSMATDKSRDAESTYQYQQLELMDMDHETGKEKKPSNENHSTQRVIIVPAAVGDRHPEIVLDDPTCLHICACIAFCVPIIGIAVACAFGTSFIESSSPAF